MAYDLAKLDLRRWRVADALRLTVAHADPEMAYQGGIRDTAAAVDWIGRVADLDNGHVYAVADAEDHPVGCVAVTNIDRHQVGWTWYWTIADIRGQGVARDALRALVDWAHHDAGLYRLELGHRTNNPASCTVAASAGFLYEGLERQRLNYDGTRYDVERHARLAPDPLQPPTRPVTVTA
ncbi:MAG TPA: GNAT family protein [Kribbella sp.]|uniref:GNAT family N-acetyltransferase n=1 Tax=Kribbella sp. TaxID=1871183 RepID=UPI002D76A671|nr:GNAT family protein [Kribbella sp.]HET6297460.1 GNAT family protein [Kribbella sp.]